VRLPARLGLRAELIGIRLRQRAARLAGLEIVAPPVTLLDGPPSAVPQRVVEARDLQFDATGGADAGGDGAEENVHQLLEVRPNILFDEVGADQTDAAVDIVADATR